MLPGKIPEYAVKWIIGPKKEWCCKHVFKNDVIIDQVGSIYLYDTEMPEPKGFYRYIFARDLLKDEDFNNRRYEHCKCEPLPKNDLKLSTSPTIMYLRNKKWEIIDERIKARGYISDQDMFPMPTEIRNQLETGINNFLTNILHETENSNKIEDTCNLLLPYMTDSMLEDFYEILEEKCDRKDKNTSYTDDSISPC
jgi:hypothetical protein